MSVICRLARVAPALHARVDDLQRTVETTGAVECYPWGSVHASVLALTQREPRERFDAARVERLAHVVAPVCSTAMPMAFMLGALNRVGPQWFAEAVPMSSSWAGLRTAVAAAARGVGEEPITFTDPEPLHVNLARVAGPADPDAVRRAMAAGAVAPVRVDVSSLEIVLTDFRVSPDATTVLRDVRPRLSS